MFVNMFYISMQVNMKACTYILARKYERTRQRASLHQELMPRLNFLKELAPGSKVKISLKVIYGENRQNIEIRRINPCYVVAKKPSGHRNPK
jgi:hypothetical protein